MKLRKLLFILLLVPLALFAQKSKPWNKPLYDAYKFHYGFAFSAGILDFSFAPDLNWQSVENDTSGIYSIEGQGRFLFGASMVGNMRLNENWDLRLLPGLYFGQRDLEFVMQDPNGSSEIISHKMSIESTLLQFPLLLKYRAERENNYRPYVVFGVNYALDLAIKKKLGANEQAPKIRLNRNDLLLEAGFGVDNYLPFFKFSGEIRFSYGLLNMVDYESSEIDTEGKSYEGYSKTIKKLGTKMVTLVIYFE